MKKLNAMSRKDHKVAEKSAKNPVEKSAENANTVAKTLAKVGEKSTNESPCLDSQVFSTRTGKGDKEKMANTQVRTKGPKVDKKQPKKVTTGKLRAKKEAAHSLAIIDSLQGMKKCVIDEWFWNSDTRNRLTDEAAVKFAYAVSEKFNGNPEPFRNVCVNGAEKPVAEALDHLQDVHKIRRYYYYRAKSFARDLVTEYSENPDLFKAPDSDSSNNCNGLKLNQIYWCLPETLRNRMEGLVAEENPHANSYYEQKLVKSLKESLLAEKLFDVASESVDDEVFSLTSAYDEYDADYEEDDETA